MKKLIFSLFVVVIFSGCQTNNIETPAEYYKGFPGPSFDQLQKMNPLYEIPKDKQYEKRN